MKSYRTLLFALLTAVLTALLLIACSGSDESDDSSTPPDVSGGHTFVLMKDDLWITVKGDGFLAKNGAGVSQFWGTVSTLSNHFSQFIVTNSNVADPVKNDVIFGLPVNDAIMLLFPKDGAVPGEPVATYTDANVALATGGSCPSAATSFMSVLGPDPSHTRSTMTYGKSQITAATSPFDFQASLISMLNDYSNPPTLTNLYTGFTCTSGQATNGSDDKMFFTPSGMALATSSDSNNTYTLVPGDTASAATKTEIVENGIKFRGWSEIVVNKNGEDENHIYPMALTGNGSKLEGGCYTNFEGNVSGGLTITINNSSGVPSGMYDTSILEEESSSTGNLRIVASKMADGRVVLVGVGDSDNESPTGYDDDKRDWHYLVMVEMP